VFLAHAGLDKKINGVLDKLDTEDVRALAAAGAQIRALVEAQPFRLILKLPSARVLRS
jgi:pyruvate,water dikinase